MLGFRKKEKEPKLNNIDSQQESTISYTEDNWTQDLNNSHEFFGNNQSINQNTRNQDNSQFVNQSIFTDYNELNENTNIIGDVNLEEQQITQTEEVTKTKKKIELSIRAKVHLTIYTLLVVFIFSMIIANAVIANANSLLLSAAGDTYEVQTSEETLNTITLPDGTKVKLNETTQKEKTEVNGFDQFCDSLEGR